MELMERDAAHIAKTLRWLRKSAGLTQENLAEAAGLSSRTIEKVETGKHLPEEQTLRSLARAFGMPVEIFSKPTIADERAMTDAIEHALRKSLLVRTRPVRTRADFRREFGGGEMLAIDAGAAETDEAISLAASMTDFMRDAGDIWSDIDEVGRVDFARSFIEQCDQLAALGLVWYMGRYRQRRRYRDQPDLVFGVHLASLQRLEGAEGERFALVDLPGAWETLEEDRPRLPD